MSQHSTGVDTQGSKSHVAPCSTLWLTVPITSLQHQYKEHQFLEEVPGGAP